MNASANNVEVEVANEQQQRTITGVVRDTDGITLPGVTVVALSDDADAALVGTTTDLDGNFSLNVPANAEILRFSFVGMQNQEVSIDGEDDLEIVMDYATTELDELVVVGYGVQRKQSVVGSIVQVTEEDLHRTGNVTDLTQSLGGQLPGIVTLTSSGEPGGVLTGESGTNVFIRGQNTWNGGQPLILVDGVERNMNNIDVNEVATISVLKDASATAVFGVKGANGVILITTKRGAPGKTILNFNYTSTGITTSKLPGKLDSYGAMNAKNEMIEREGVINESSWNDYVPYEIVQRYQLPQTEEYRVIYPNVDWEDAMFRDMGFAHKATLSARGGSEDVQYYGLVGYTQEGDMFEKYDNYKGYDPNYNFNRLNFRSNIDFRLTNTTKLQMNLSGYYSQKNTNWNNEGSTSRADAWMWAAAYRMPPNLFLPMYDDGRWGAYQEGGNNSVNPIAVVHNIGVRETRATQLNSDFVVEQNLGFITEGLSARANFFYDNSIRSEGGIYDVQNSIRANEARTNVPFKQIYPMQYEGPDQDPSEYTAILPVDDAEYDWMLRPWSIRQESIGSANWSGYIPVTRRMSYQGQINFNRTFDVHGVTAMGLFKREEYARGNMFKNYREDWIFRTTYDYDTRYLFEFNGAYNGSEQFGPGYRFDFFPSVAAGWVVSNESFFNIDAINNLRFRYSIGVVGDDNVSGSRWLYDSQLSYGGRARINEQTNQLSPYYFYRESVVGNPDVRWETAVKSNYGLEFGMFLDMITLSVDYFTEDRTDILMSGGSRSVPPFFGATPPSANLGHVKSQGFEVELGFDHLLTNNVRVWSDLALTHNQNEVLSRDDAPLMDPHLKSEGFQIGQQKRVLQTGFYNTWDEVYASVPTENNDLSKLPGYYDLLDFNADGVIKGNEDTAPIGYSGVPQNSASLSLGATYKGLNVMAQLYGTNNANRWIPLNNYYSNYDVLFDHVADYWSKDNPNASSYLPRWQTQGENVGHYHLYDASYIRLRTVDISYSFRDNKWAQQAGFSNIRVFLTANNLFFWSNLPDDRETTHSGAGASTGAYPTTRRTNLGIDVTF
ncbi:MAG: TonB-dependent receptor [Balneolales bacterium]